jgi:hypothetical protein
VVRGWLCILRKNSRRGLPLDGEVSGITPTHPSCINGAFARWLLPAGGGDHRGRKRRDAPPWAEDDALLTLGRLASVWARPPSPAGRAHRTPAPGPCSAPPLSARATIYPRQHTLPLMAPMKRGAASGCFLGMEEREQLELDLEHYRTLLVYITDEQAAAAIRQLIWEIRQRLDRVEDADCDP